MIEVKSNFDTNSLKPFVKFQYKQLIPLCIVLPLVFILLGGLTMWLGESYTGFPLGIGLIVFGLVFMPIILLLMRNSNKQQEKSNRLISTETLISFRFEDTRIYHEAKKGDEYTATCEFAYTIINKVIETPTHFFVYISTAQSYVICKADIVTGTAHDLSCLLYTKVGAAAYSQVGMKK